MLRLYQQISSCLASFMARHEKDIFTTGARVLAVICITVAVLMAFRLGSSIL